MEDFYRQFYTLATASPVHAEFCERVFGRNLCQHGFADMGQLDKLIEVMQLHPGQHALDIGCGNGMIAEYVSDCTGAEVTGIDYVPQAIQQAAARTASKKDHLHFRVGDINTLDLPTQTYDVVISIDSLYFSTDYIRTIQAWVQALKPGGQLAILFAYGREPWVLKEDFPVDSIQPDRTPLAAALQAHGLAFQTWDFTADDLRLACLREAVLTDLRPRLEAEGLQFVYENRIGDARGIRQAIEDGLHARYLYHVQIN